MKEGNILVVKPEDKLISRGNSERGPSLQCESLLIRLRASVKKASGNYRNSAYHYIRLMKEYKFMTMTDNCEMPSVRLEEALRRIPRSLMKEHRNQRNPLARIFFKGVSRQTHNNDEHPESAPDSIRVAFDPDSKVNEKPVCSD
jgi:hypothetical protein